MRGVQLRVSVRQFRNSGSRLGTRDFVVGLRGYGATRIWGYERAHGADGGAGVVTGDGSLYDSLIGVVHWTLDIEVLMVHVLY